MVKKQKKIKSKPFLERKISGVRLFVIFGAIIGLIIGLFQYSVRAYNRERARKAIGFIRDVRVLKNELEQELGVKLKEDVNCTQSSGKSSTKNSPWGCVTSFSGRGYTLNKDQLIDRFKKSYLLAEPRLLEEVSGNTSLLGYTNNLNHLPCQALVSDSFYFSCSFSIPNAVSDQIFKELGISRPASNND